MKRIFVRSLTIIGGLALLLVVVGLGIVVVSWMGKGRIPNKTILEADFEQGLIEYVPDDPLAQVMLAKTPVVRDTVEALERAAEDDRVVALVARVGVADLGLARIQEVHNAIMAFRSKGKPAIAHAETFGEFGPAATRTRTASRKRQRRPSAAFPLTPLKARGCVSTPARKPTRSLSSPEHINLALFL
jgi:protease-4